MALPADYEIFGDDSNSSEQSFGRNARFGLASMDGRSSMHPTEYSQTPRSEHDVSNLIFDEYETPVDEFGFVDGGCK
jgi:hypothetical protein